MRTYQTSARVTAAACWAVAAVVLLLLPGAPWVLDLYHSKLGPLTDTGRTTLLVAFYLCAPAVLFALWNMVRLLKNILAGDLFVTENVRWIRRIRWCCLWVSVVCLCATSGFLGLCLISVIMAFLCLSVTVVGQVMKAGVEIKEENDLTV